MTTVVSMFRCAECGSGRVEPYVNGKKMRYSSFALLKAQNIDEYRCPDCGAVLDHPMSEAEKAKLDSMVVISSETKETVDKHLEQYKNLEINPITHILKNI